MRTALLFLIIGLTVCTFCKAQDIPVLPQEKFRHHEFSVSYGFLPITDANSMAEECFAPVLSFGVYTREKTNYYGALSISYIYRFNRKISLGVTGGITGNKGTASSLYEALDENTKDNRRYLYILPTFRWHWFLPPQILSVYLSRARCLFPPEQFWRRSLSQDKIRLSIQFSRHRIRKPVCLLHRIRSRIYRNNRSRRPLSFLTYEAATASVNTLMRTPSTSLSASAQAVVVAPVVNTSSIISTCFLAKASARRRQKIPSTFSHRS